MWGLWGRALKDRVVKMSARWLPLRPNYANQILFGSNYVQIQPFSGFLRLRPNLENANVASPMCVLHIPTGSASTMWLLGCKSNRYNLQKSNNTNARTFDYIVGPSITNSSLVTWGPMASLILCPADGYNVVPLAYGITRLGKNTYVIRL